MAETPLVGTWKLLSGETRTQDGQVDYPYGAEPVGYITYNDQGYVFVGIMKADRSRFALEDRWLASAAETKAAFLSHIGYCGRHNIEVCSSPNWTGGTQERFFDLDGDRLSLSTAPFPQRGEMRSSYLIWERV